MKERKPTKKKTKPAEETRIRFDKNAPKANVHMHSVYPDKVFDYEEDSMESLYHQRVCGAH